MRTGRWWAPGSVAVATAANRTAVKDFHAQLTNEAGLHSTRIAPRVLERVRATTIGSFSTRTLGEADRADGR